MRLQVMATESKRPPVCGALSLAVTMFTWLLLYRMYRSPPFLRDDTRHKFFFSLLVLYGCAFGGFILAVVALALRERFWILPALALLLDLARAGFFSGRWSCLRYKAILQGDFIWQNA